MRTLSSKAGAAILTVLLLAGPAASDPLFGFAPADSSAWRPDTLSIACQTGQSRRDSLYLTNDSGAATGALSLEFLSDFHADGGGSIASGEFFLSPPALDSLAAGEERLVILNLHLSPTVPPAVYHATLAARRADLTSFDEVVVELNVRGGDRLRVVPNPVYSDRHRGVDFRVSTEDGLALTLDIYTLGMEKVRSLRSPAVYSGEGLDDIHWDLSNTSGRGVASGMYLVRARYERLGVESTEIHRVMVIR